MTQNKMDDETKKKLKLRVVQKRKMKGYARPKIQAALDAGNIQDVIDALNPQQRLFCENYIISYNGADAYRKAGYKGKYPAKAAYQMLQTPGIRACIDQMTLQRADESIIKPEYVVKKIVKTIEKAEKDNNHSAVLRGCELMARHLGMFIERQEVSGPNGNPIELKAVRDAADAFTSAVAGLVERGREGNLSLVTNGRSKS
jgi:phage terminase small subunit